MQISNVTSCNSFHADNRKHLFYRGVLSQVCSCGREYLVNGQKVPERPETSNMYNTRTWYPVRYLLTLKTFFSQMFKNSKDHYRLFCHPWIVKYRVCHRPTSGHNLHCVCLYIISMSMLSGLFQTTACSHINWQYIFIFCILGLYSTPLLTHS